METFVLDCLLMVVFLSLCWVEPIYLKSYSSTRDYNECDTQTKHACALDTCCNLLPNT